MSNIAHSRSWYDIYISYMTESVAMQVIKCVNFMYRDGSFNDVEDWKKYVSEQYQKGTPIKVLYLLETPIETPLSKEELDKYKSLTMNYPITTLISDAHIQVKYVADTKGYIDKKFTELATALI